MSERPPVLERAFQLVEFDACRSMAKVRERLAAEGFTSDEVAELTPEVVGKLTALLEKRGSHESN